MRYCGRAFTSDEIQGIRKLIEDHPTATRAHLSRLVCEQLGWRRDDGRSKDMSCRVAMLRMQDDGLLRLPPPRNGNNNGKPYLRRTLLAEPAAPRDLTLQRDVLSRGQLEPRGRNPGAREARRPPPNLGAQEGSLGPSTP